MIFKKCLNFIKVNCWYKVYNLHVRPQISRDFSSLSLPVATYKFHAHNYRDITNFMQLDTCLSHDGLTYSRTYPWSPLSAFTSSEINSSFNFVYRFLPYDGVKFCCIHDFEISLQPQLVFHREHSPCSTVSSGSSRISQRIQSVWSSIITMRAVDYYWFFMITVDHY
jgi:hypothetical protein